ncbi:pentatricopeptide repeat-containing protein At1g20230-like [Mangifera indica]|uniref:pentatricopeptide repeat-containing protein At1g20230-like n=1 Tax=Mangifera indica TaxID=29780 RepID=UPI001CF9AE4A|nr:pentatricopeptide repeat-containing protein At1g20230-like [Mangifera indica]XP_044481880.1 pentatricopeptide repeat-containing protein At1g20230-like [Mangifera indica]XP_044481881.1 pentatricopeptide repeat-containing protein At1g20230-like [Mangifera indica]XP_044481882.1 pentatricopeptide repeat-containing protein At1g20230-like [Mangifera indica]XP_044481883.1 pentatricopeptide repeat-containing protein At1g20230-like [Mangifera indica]
MFPKLPQSHPPGLSFKVINSFLGTGDLQRARQLIDEIPQPDLRSWTRLISAYTQHGFPKEAIKIYSTLKLRNIRPDNILILSVAKACALASDLVKAKEVHEDAIRFGFQSDTLLSNALIDMYAKCRNVDGARQVFDDICVKNVVSWTSMCSSYMNCGLLRQGLEAFREMGLNGVRPNSVTVSSVLPACSELRDVNLGRQMHGFVIRNGMESNAFVSSALVNMYASCIRIREAEVVFSNMSQRDVVSWNGILTACFLNEEFEKGLALFYQMRNEGVKPNTSSWNVVIVGCTQNGRNELALELLGHMQDAGLKPNQITVISVLPACTNLESLKGGKEIHAFVCRNWLIEDLKVTTALIFMYAKCGNLELSERVFSLMPIKDTVAWNTMIIANSMHGNGKQSLFLFREMLDAGIRPDSFTFIGVLSGCSHSCLVDEASLIFNSMSRDHSVEPDAEHFSCMVDVLSRAGHLEEAYEFIQRMPKEPTAGAWGALLGACRVYKNVELGRKAASRLFEIEPDNPGNYVLLYNIFVAAKLWGEASETRKMMRDRNVLKTQGCSWVQVRNKVYTFVVGDRNSMQNCELYRFLDEMSEKMRLAGYMPNTEFVLQDVIEEEKEDILCNHSEKLAVAFAILNVNGESSIRVFKNLRICGDCHHTIKFIAKVVGLQIIVRDSLRFHHFSNGYCSCRDFW